MKLRAHPPNDRILSDAIMNQLTSFSDSEIEQIASLCLGEGITNTIEASLDEPTMVKQSLMSFPSIQDGLYGSSVLHLIEIS